MYTQAEFKNMLFIDIETATQFKDYKDFKKNGSSHMVELWSKKADSIRLYESHKANLSDQEMYEDCAAIHSEFSKIIVITIGQVKFDEIGLPYTSNIRSFYGDNEKELLEEFLKIMSAVFSKNPSVQLVGHNIKKFDMPWIVRRSLINGIIPPTQFHFQKQKPWENCLVDTYEIWKFGGMSSATLDLVCGVFDIPSPKDAMRAEEVSGCYWNNQLEDIKEYCEKDVQATINVMLKMSNMPIL